MQTFSTLCDGKYYVIPPNQRGYSWGPHEVEAIFSDLDLAGTHAHYMGPIIVTRTETDDFQDAAYKTTAEFRLEDGQQRLTTFFLIANEIRKRIDQLNAGESPEVEVESKELHRLLFFKHEGISLRIKNSNPELDQFLNFIISDSPVPPARRTPPMVAMEQCRNWIRQRVSQLLLNSLLLWKNKITNQAKFIWVNLKDEGVDRYLTFDAINSRGLPLSEFDKLKNFCILLDSKRDLSLQAEEEWYKAITYLEDFGVAARKEESTFISEAFSVFFNQRVGQDQVHDAFVRRFSSLLTSSNPTLEANLVEFVRFWEFLAKSFGFVATKRRGPYYGTLCTTSAGAWLNRLDNMELPGITRVLLTACHHKFSSQDFEQVARACEILTFRYYAVFARRKDLNAGNILKLAHEVLTNKASLSDVLGRFCQWLSGHASLANVVDELASGRAKYYHDRDVKGWAHCYYFLYEYELFNSPKGVEPIAWESSGQGRVNTQEHILPQAHRDGGWWQGEWPDEAEADRYKHRLGNLTLTTNNHALGRKPISLKLDDPGSEHSFAHPNATNSEKRVVTFTNGHEWKAANILQRELEMLKFAVTRWSLPCCSDNGEIPLPKDFQSANPDWKAINVAVPDCIECSSDIEQEEIQDEQGEEEPNTI